MTHKWNITMMNTLIGRKKIGLIIVVILSFGLNSCIFEYFEDEPADYIYTIYFKNATADTLNIILGNDSLDYGEREFVLNPLDSVPYYGIGLDKGDDVNERLFSGRKTLMDQARIYRNDSLIVSWYGPPREMPDSEHHFFNYHSWDHWLIDRFEGIVRFTIYEEDFH